MQVFWVVVVDLFLSNFGSTRAGKPLGLKRVSVSSLRANFIYRVFICRFTNVVLRTRKFVRLYDCGEFKEAATPTPLI